MPHCFPKGHGSTEPRIEVSYNDTAIVVDAFVERYSWVEGILDGGTECWGFGYRTVYLDEPVGDRVLIDGATGEVARLPGPWLTST